jgi:hypothetical protein
MNKPNYYAILPANVRYDKELPASAKLLYAEITALCNTSGFCWATNGYFADLYGMTARNISRLISQLNNLGYISVEIVNEFDRKIYISQGCDKNVLDPTLKNSRGYDENVLASHDKNVYKNNTSINTKKNIKENKINIGEIEREFEKLWTIYPRKMGKKKAFDSFLKSRKTKKVPYETIENGLYRYLRHIEDQGVEEQYIQHGSTFFNQEKWQDEFITTGVNRKPKNAMEYMKMKYGQGEEPNEPNRNGEVIDYYTTLIPEPFQGF